MRTHSLALVNNVSVFWHVVGVAVIIAILVFVPDDHQSVDFVFTERFNNSGFTDGGVSSFMFWIYVLPLGFLLDAVHDHRVRRLRAHLRGDARRIEVRGARRLAVDLLLGDHRLVRPARDHVRAPSTWTRSTRARGSSLAIFDSALTPAAAKAVVLISTIGQLFCGVACLTSASRMCFAFSRDRGLPGSKTLSKVNSKGVPVAAVLTMAIAALVVTLPALEGDENAFPYAFFAVVSITVIGLYIAYVIPIYLRWRQGTAFVQSPAWNLGNKWRWMNPFAVVWVGDHHGHLQPPVHARGGAVERRRRRRRQVRPQVTSTTPRSRCCWC